jgi:hypothetical protein
MPHKRAVLKLATLLLLFGSSCGNSAFACSLVNVAVSTANSVTISGYYWIASGVLGCAIVCIELYRVRRSLILAITVALLVFHPRWMLAPLYGPDCTFQNVQASQFVLIAILLLGYEIFRVARSHRRTSN